MVSERVVASRQPNEVRTLKEVLEFLRETMQVVMSAPVFQLVLGIVTINVLNRVSYEIEVPELDFDGKVVRVSKIVKLIDDGQAGLLTTLLISAQAAPLIQALFSGIAGVVGAKALAGAGT